MMKVNILNPPQAHTIPSIAGMGSRPPVPYTMQQSVEPCTNQHRSEKLKSLVCEYIDYLIEENEHITQISTAYTMPTPLDFENEHYFEEVRNTAHPFPSERFQVWLKMKECETVNMDCNKQSTFTEASSPPEPKRQRKK